MSDTYITHFGGSGTPLGRRQGGEIVGPSGGTPIAVTQGDQIWLGPFAQGAPQFYCDGKYVRAGSNQGPVVFNIRDNGPYISIGDGMGQSHHLSTTDKKDPMALAATACAWLGDMHLRNLGADVVDGSDYRINTPYPDNTNYTHTRGDNGVRWSNRAVPDDLIARFGKDNLSPELNQRLIESRTPSSASKRYQWCGDSAHLLKREAAKEAEEIARAAGLSTYEFDGDTLLCQGVEQLSEKRAFGPFYMNAINTPSEPVWVSDVQRRAWEKENLLGWFGKTMWVIVIVSLLFWLLH